MICFGGLLAKAALVPRLISRSWAQEAFQRPTQPQDSNLRHRMSQSHRRADRLLEGLGLRLEGHAAEAAAASIQRPSISDMARRIPDSFRSTAPI
jgi:hypothetical protein